METEIVGREQELAQIHAFLAQDGPSALLLEGEPGIGKTTLWRAAVEVARARGHRVLTSRPSGSETKLSFAALRDLVDSSFDEAADALPAPQRRALAVALLREEPGGDPPPHGAVVAGFVGVLSRLAKDAQLLVAIDDIQWLDAPTASLVEFAARRVGDAPIRFLVARRIEGRASPPLGLAHAFEDRLSVVTTGPLTLGALHRVLRDRLGVSLSRPVLRRIHDVSTGNPFFALELTKALQRRGVDRAPDQLPLPGTLHELLGERLTTLPERTKDALLLAATSAQPTLGLISTILGADAGSILEPAVASGVVQPPAEAIHFAHPLFASAVYDAASASARLRAHELLARASSDLEERATHLAHARSEPDAEIAKMIENAAHEVLHRGARAAAAELFESSARLTPSDAPLDRGRRVVDAAWALYEAGDAQHSRALLTSLVAELPEGTVRCEARWRLGTILDETGDWREAMALWGDALAATDEPAVRAEIGRSMAITSAYTGSATEAVRLAEDAIRAADESGDTKHRAAALAARAFVALTSGAQDARAIIDRSLALEAGLDLGLGELSPAAVDAEIARQAMDIRGARERYEAILARALELGNATLEQWAAFGLCSVELLAGRLVHAVELADSVLDLSDQLGVMRIPAMNVRALAEAHAGDPEAAKEMALAAIETARPAGERLHLFNALAAMGVVELAAGNPHAAARVLRDARAVALDLGVAFANVLRAFLNETEAAASAGALDQASEALGAYEEAVTGGEPAWALPLAERARGILAGALGDLEAAARHLEAARAHAFAEMPFEHARTLLALGQLRRRTKQRRGARETLEQASALFEELGACSWAEKARAELARVGGRVPAGEVLTATERRVADLVAEGRSNKEVAAALFVTVKAVEANLSRVYAKLGIRSRTELARLLSGGDGPGKT